MTTTSGSVAEPAATGGPESGRPETGGPETGSSRTGEAQPELPASRGPAAGGARRGRAAAVLLALLGVLGALTATASWTLATPVGANPDEPDHIYYSWAVVTGQAFGDDVRVSPDDEDDIVVTVPTVLTGFIPAECYAFDAAQPVGRCRAALPPGGEVDVLTHMQRYPVAFYAPVGGVMWLAERSGLGADGILYAARTAGALLCLALLLPAALLLARRYDPLVVTAVVLLTLTPMAWFTIGAVNPSGLEICAVALVAAAVLAVRHDAATRGRPGPAALAALLAGVLVAANARPLSVVWAGAVAVVLLLPVGTPEGRRRLSALPRWVVAAVPVVFAAGLAWVFWAAQLRADDATSASTEQYEALAAPEQLMFVALKLGDMALQAIGVLGWLDTPLPDLVYVLWLGAVGAVVAAWLRGRPADPPRWVVPLVFALGTAVVVVHSWQTGFGWQGRYMLPVYVSAAVLAVPGLAEAVRRRDVSRGLLVSVGALAVVVQAVAALWTYGRHAYGLVQVTSRFPRAPLTPDEAAAWLPVGGTTVLVGLTAAGGVLLLAALDAAYRSSQAAVELSREP